MELSPKRKAPKLQISKSPKKAKQFGNINVNPDEMQGFQAIINASSPPRKKQFGTIVTSPREMERFKISKSSSKLELTPSTVINLEKEGEGILTSLEPGEILKLPANTMRTPIYVDILKKLGSGTYGDVYEVKPRLNPKQSLPDYFPEDETYALKIMKDTNDTRSFEYEQNIMNVISHAFPEYIPHCAPHVACYFDISKDKNGRYFFLAEKMDGDASDYIRDILNVKTKKSKSVNVDFDNRMKFALNLFKQVIEGLEELKKVGIIHRDLKPANILYRIPKQSYKRKSKTIEKKQTTNVQFKLGDFGLSCSLVQKDLECGKFITGTPRYIDPKLYDDVVSGRASKMNTIWDETNDIYSLAVILFEIIFKEVYLTLNVYQKTKFPRTLTQNQRVQKLQEMKDSFEDLYKQVSSVSNGGYIDDIITVYKDKPKYRQLLEFIMRNMKPFDKKQTIKEVKDQYKSIFRK